MKAKKQGIAGSSMSVDVENLDCFWTTCNGDTKAWKLPDSAIWPQNSIFSILHIYDVYFTFHVLSLNLSMM